MAAVAEKWLSRRGLRKLGACPKCIRASALGALVSWLGFTAITAVGLHGATRSLCLVVAVAFTALSLTHFVVFFLRSRTLWRGVLAEHGLEEGASAASGRAVPGHVTSSTRRAFFTVTGTTLAAIVAGPVVGWSRRPAEAETGDCVVRCIERQYTVLSSCLLDCQAVLRGCAQAEDLVGCVSAYQSCTVRCTQRVPLGSVREFCESACNRGSTTSSSTSSSSTTSTTTDCGPFGCGG